MRKTKRQLFWILLVLAGSALFYAALSLLNSAPPQENGVALNTFDADAINGISYLSNGETVALEKDAEGLWYAPAEPQRVLRQGLCSAMATQSGRLKAADIAAEGEQDLSVYGLDAPANRITLRQGARQVSYLIGDQNAVTGDYYLQIQGEPQIYTVKKAFAEAFFYDLAYLTQPEESV